MEFHLLSPAESSTTDEKIKGMKLRLRDYDNNQGNINIILIMYYHVED